LKNVITKYESRLKNVITKYESRLKNVIIRYESQLKNMNNGVSYQRVSKMLTEMHYEKTSNGQVDGLEK